MSEIRLVLISLFLGMRAANADPIFIIMGSKIVLAWPENLSGVMHPAGS